MEWPRIGILLIVALVLALMLPLAEAAVPRQISLSGVRTNASGGPERSVTHLNVNFTIFDAQSGGRMLDTREINITTNFNGFWFTNYSTAGFDTEVPMWFSINNTSPRIFMGPSPYSGQFLARNETNSINSSLTLVSTANLRGFQSTSLVNSTHINASALGYAAIPVTATGVNLFSNLLSAASTFSGANIFSGNNVFTAGQQFADLNVSGDVNVTFTSGTGRFHVFAADGSRLFGIEDVPNAVHSIFDFNLTNGGRQDAFSVRNVLVEVFKISTVGSGIVTIGGTLNVSNMTHRSGGLMINDTGGINASAVGFGTVPQGVMDSARTWTAAQTFTGNSRFFNLNVSGDVNITSATESARTFAVFDVAGIRGFAVDTANAILHAAYILNISNNGNANSLAVRNAARDIFRVDTTGGGALHTYGTLNITNMTAGGQSGALLINTTGGINASAVGFGTVPQGVLPVFPDGAATPTNGLRAAFGNAIGIVGVGTSAEVIVNLSAGFACTTCYRVAVSHANGTGTVMTFIVTNVNASQFNITAQAGAAPPFMNVSWIAIGY